LGVATQFANTANIPNLPAMKMFLAIIGVAWIGYVAFCVFVFVGLVRMRNWARICIAILGALKLIFWGLMSIAMMGLRNRMPGTNPATASVSSTFWIGLALIYGLLAMIGLWWVIYFNLKPVRKAFKERDGASLAVEGSGAGGYSFWHVVVIVFAWFLLVGGLWMLAMAFVRVPFWFLGVTFRRFAAASAELVYAGLSFYCGIGLLRRWRMAFRIAVVLQVISFISLCVALLPGATRQILAVSVEINQRFGLPSNPQFMESHEAFIRIIYGFSLALIFFWLYALFRCRHIFEGRALESTPGAPID
jgi:hypothetical protein